MTKRQGLPFKLLKALFQAKKIPNEQRFHHSRLISNKNLLYLEVQELCAVIAHQDPHSLEFISSKILEIQNHLNEFDMDSLATLHKASAWQSFEQSGAQIWNTCIEFSEFNAKLLAQSRHLFASFEWSSPILGSQLPLPFL